MQTTWIVQERLGSNCTTLDSLTRACNEVGAQIATVNVRPFSLELPEMPAVDFPFVLYGYTTLITNALADPKWKRGVFFDPEALKPTEYQKHFGELFLNSDLKAVSPQEFRSLSFPENKRLFVRHNNDLKRMVGGIIRHEDWAGWYDFASTTPDNEAPDAFNSHSAEIVYCEPKEIDAEWRVVLVDGLPITSSQYSPCVHPFTPCEVLDVARQAANCWTPLPVMVMDIALCEGQYKVVELNCFNGSAFYACDLPKIIRYVSRYQECLVP